MTLQFGSGGGVPSFATAPSAGTPSIAIGTGTFAGGAAPDFQGTSAIGVNMAAGYAGNLLSLQLAGVSLAKIDQTGKLTLSAIVSSGGIACTNNANTFIGSNTVTASVASVTPMVGVGVASQTGDLLSLKDSVPTKQFSIANAGTGVAPLWALRVAPVANAESMAQAHVGGASTGKAIQVIDNAGTTVGWLQLLA